MENSPGIRKKCLLVRIGMKKDDLHFIEKPYSKTLFDVKCRLSCKTLI